MAKSTGSKPHILPEAVALELARLAGVPDCEREQFCTLIEDPVKSAWQYDRRAVPSTFGPELAQAAKAARKLNKAVSSLDKADRKWVDHIVENHSWFFQEHQLRRAREDFELEELISTLDLLDKLFSTAIGRPSPIIAGTTASLKGSIKDRFFVDFVWGILTCAREAGGHFTFAKNDTTGTLSVALKTLRQHLPKGLIPNVLPAGTIQKIKTQHEKARGWALSSPTNP